VKLPPPRRDWSGLIAYTLALGLAVGFATALIMSASSRTPPINETTGAMLSTIGGAMVGAVATYLGGAAQRRRDRDVQEDEDRERDG
jgi:purine-cytosine permease-like protein